MRTTLIIISCFLWSALAQAQSGEQLGQAQIILDRFAQVLLVEFPIDSERQLVPLLHDTFKDNKLTWLKRQYRDLDFMRARRAISRYQNPVRIVRSKKYDQDGISLGPKKEVGELFDFFIAKKDTAGYPAPIRIFFPTTGSPVIVSFGGL